MSNVIIKKTCFQCKKEHELHLPETGYNAWQEGAYIQDAMPQVSADDRELLISGICGKCFDGLFADEDE